MKIFNKKVKNEDILNRIDYVISKINEVKTKLESTSADRERVLEDIAFNAKREKIKEYEDIITRIKNESNCRQIIIDQQQETIEKLRATNQELCGKAGGATAQNNKLKKENEDLKKEIRNLEAEIKELKSDRYKVIGVRPTKPKKQIIGVKKGISSGAVKTELKKINELREKEEV